jgi:hypothetical protein
MTRTLWLLLFAPVLAAAAPVPPPSEKEQIEKLWGKIVSPAAECEFKLAGKALTIRTAGQPARGLRTEKEPIPRVSRTVVGDFEMTVKVADSTPPARHARHTDSWPWTRAGLYVVGGGYTVEFHLSQYYTKANGELNEKLTRAPWVDTWHPRGGSGSQIGNVEPGKSVYLRLVRKGNAITVAHGTDGEKWSNPFNPRQAVEFPAEVTVGVFVSHGTFQPVEATFDGLRIERLNEKPR